MPPSPGRPSSSGSSGTLPFGWRPGRFKSRVGSCASLVVAARLPDEPGGLVLEADVIELPQPLHHRVAAPGIVEEVADTLLVGAQERVDLRDTLEVDAGGADQRQRGEP